MGQCFQFLCFFGSIGYNLSSILTWMFCLHFSYQPKTTIMIAMFSWTAPKIYNASWWDKNLSFNREQQIQESYPDENAVLMFEKCSLERICKCKSFISMQFPLLPHQLKNSEGTKDIQKKKSLSSAKQAYTIHIFLSHFQNGAKYCSSLFPIDWLIQVENKKPGNKWRVREALGSMWIHAASLERKTINKAGWLLWGCVVMPAVFSSGRNTHSRRRRKGRRLTTGTKRRRIPRSSVAG